jgi:flagellar basal-body rod protein FlgG
MGTLPGGSKASAATIQDLPSTAVRVLQGFRERSNVEPVREMVDMIATVRAYETAQRAVVAHDQTLQSLFDVMRR